MLYFAKEIRVSNEWRYYGGGFTNNDKLTALIQKYSDKSVLLGRKHNDITELEIRFHSPSDFTRTSRVSDLVHVREVVGKELFDKTFGYWPWDDITCFNHPEEVEFMKQYSISDARLVTWRN